MENWAYVKLPKNFSSEKVKRKQVVFQSLPIACEYNKGLHLCGHKSWDMIFVKSVTHSENEK